jgi:hypothetical protein
MKASIAQSFLLLLIVLPCLGGCRRSGGSRSLIPQTFTLTQPQLQGRIAPRFPVTLTKSVATVSLENPKVLLRDGSGRIGIELDARVWLPLGQPLAGTAAITGELGYEPSAGAFHFRNPRIDKLDLAGIRPEHDDLARKAAEAVAMATLNAIPVYELNHSMTEFAASVMLRDVTVKNGALHVSVALP